MVDTKSLTGCYPLCFQEQRTTVGVKKSQIAEIIMLSQKQKMNQIMKGRVENVSFIK